MPFLASVEGAFGYGRPPTSASDPTNPITSGNATVVMSSNTYTQISGVAGVDDGFGYIPTAAGFPFTFFGSNYGSGSANNLYWNTNNVVGFGTGTNTITWVANTGRGILCGNFDRRTNNAVYSTVVTTGNFQYLPIRVWFQNIYNAGSANEGQMQIRLARNTLSGSQYIEYRIFKGSGGVNGGAITSGGSVTNSNWNITDGISFKNTFAYTFSNFPADNTSFVISSDSNGSNWTFSNTSYLDF
jgi:hypothetical protein